MMSISEIEQRWPRTIYFVLGWLFGLWAGYSFWGG